MTWVVAIVGLMLIGAWIDQLWAQRRRKRSKQPVQWGKDPDDGPEGDY